MCNLTTSRTRCSSSASIAFYGNIPLSSKCWSLKLASLDDQATNGAGASPLDRGLRMASTPPWRCLLQPIVCSALCSVSARPIVRAGLGGQTASHAVCPWRPGSECGTHGRIAPDAPAAAFRRQSCFLSQSRAGSRPVLQDGGVYQDLPFPHFCHRRSARLDPDPQSCPVLNIPDTLNTNRRD